MNTQTREHRHYSPSANVSITQSAIAIVALILAALAIGALLMLPSYIDARIEAGSAKAEAVADEARVHSRVALDKVEDVRTKLAEKGIKINLDGH